MLNQKPALCLEVLADLHVAYVGNGAGVVDVIKATQRVRHLDATKYCFGNTFIETLNLNQRFYNVV